MNPKLFAGISGLVLMAVLWLAMLGVVYIGYLVVLALRKYTGG